MKSKGEIVFIKAGIFGLFVIWCGVKKRIAGSLPNNPVVREADVLLRATANFYFEPYRRLSFIREDEVESPDKFPLFLMKNLFLFDFSTNYLIESHPATLH